MVSQAWGSAAIALCQLVMAVVGSPAAAWAPPRPFHAVARPGALVHQVGEVQARRGEVGAYLQDLGEQALGVGAAAALAGIDGSLHLRVERDQALWILGGGERMRLRGRCRTGQISQCA